MLSAVAAQEQPAPRAPAPAAAAQARGTAERGRETDGGQLDSPLALVASHTVEILAPSPMRTIDAHQHVHTRRRCMQRHTSRHTSRCRR
jgi:hypothetical protein